MKDDKIKNLGFSDLKDLVTSMIIFEDFNDSFDSLQINNLI